MARRRSTTAGRAAPAPATPQDGAALTGRDVPLIQVRPRTSAQRDALVAAAKAAKVSLSYYVLESALMVAEHEGFSAPPAPGWRPPGLPLVVPLPRTGRRG